MKLVLQGEGEITGGYPHREEVVWDTAGRRLSSRQEEIPLSKPAIPTSWSLAPILQIWEKSNFHCLSHSVYGALFWQPITISCSLFLHSVILFMFLRCTVYPRLQYGFYNSVHFTCDFPHSSVRSACNSGDPGLIPGLGRSPGEENGNSLFLPVESYGQRILAGVAWVGHNLATKPHPTFHWHPK